MAWRQHGRASVSPRNPRAFGICDRCGFLYNRADLSYQFEYGGWALVNTRALVCRICLDVPQPQLKPRVLSADPQPIYQPRPEPYAVDEA